MAPAPVPTDAQLMELLGPAFLAYVCNASSDEIAVRISSDSCLPRAEQETVLAQTVKVARQLAADRRPMTINNEAGYEPIDAAFEYFGQRLPDAGESLANALRRAAGGSVPELPQGDPLKRALGAMAVDGFPVMLIPESRDNPFGFPGIPRMAMSRSALNHPSMKAFIEALNAEGEPLRQLFPDGEIDPMTSSTQMLSTSGRGGSMQPIGMPASFLANAERRVRLAAEVTADAYLAAVAAQVDELRVLATGEPVEVPVGVGLVGVQVDGELRFETPWGVVTAADDWHRRQSFPGAPASTQLVLVTSISLSAEFGPDLLQPESFKGPSKGFLDTHAELERRIDLVRLSLTLAVERMPPLAVLPTFRMITDPGFHSGLSWSATPPAGAVQQISADDRESVEEWGRIVESGYHPSLALAVRRTLGSIVSRQDPADGLVDAVIALENMFGTGQSEVGFRLSAALAWLLESDAAGRVARQREVNQLYNLRSQIVHGAEVDAVELQQRREAASQLAVDAMRKLFRDVPDLIEEGEQRGKLMILRGGEAVDTQG